MRTKAIKWWKLLNLSQQKRLCSIYHGWLGGFRTPQSLTGREIEFIYKRQVNLK